MKKQFKLILLAAVLASCGKTIEYSNDFGTLRFINASPGTPGLNLLIDSINQTSSAVVYRGSSLPLNVSPGERRLLLRTPNLTAPGTFLFPASLQTETFLPQTSYTYFGYDTLATPTSTLKVIRLTDDLTEAPAGFVKVRFIPLAPNAGPADITFVRTTGSVSDSVTISNRSYVGANPTQAQLDALATFIQIPASTTGSTYQVRLKAAGTQTVLGTSSFSTVVGTIPRGGVYTFYSTGGARNFPLELRGVRQAP